MNELPYFLLEIKKNILLYSFIINNSFNNIDFKNHTIDVWSNQMTEIKDFKLTDDMTFSSVDLAISELGSSITFKTYESKYFNNPKKYFCTDSTVNMKEYEMFGLSNKTSKKRLGYYYLGEKKIHITLFNSELYGYTIYLSF